MKKKILALLHTWHAVRARRRASRLWADLNATTRAERLKIAAAEREARLRERRVRILHAEPRSAGLNPSDSIKVLPYQPAHRRTA